MKYYALFYTAKNTEGAGVAGIVKSPIPKNYNGDIRQAMIRVIEKRQKCCDIIDHFIVEITKAEFEKENYQ